MPLGKGRDEEGGDGEKGGGGGLFGSMYDIQVYAWRFYMIWQRATGDGRRTTLAGLLRVDLSGLADSSVVSP